MRIVIDLQGNQSTGSRNRGIGRYSQALATHIAKHKGQHDIHIVLNAVFADSIDSIKASFADLIPKENIHVFEVVSPSNSLSPEHEENRKFNEAMREAFIGSLAPGFVLITSLFEGLVDDAIGTVNLYTSLPTAVVLYDLIPFINKKPYLENPVVANWYLKKIENVKRTDLLLSISASAGQEAIDYLGFTPNQVTNISTACDDQFQKVIVTQADFEHFDTAFNINKPFVMYTGGIDYRKNIEGLIRAYADLPKDIRQQHQLAVVCSVHEPDRIRLTALAKEHGLGKDDFIMTGFVSEEDLVKLYNACKLFIFPSWHEGFGLPALEAMQCGAAVIASNNSSLPEVVGLDEALFDPLNDESITAKLQQGLTDDAFRQRLIKHGVEQAKKFNWDDIAKTAITALEQSYNRRPTVSPIVPSVPRPRLAYLSPLPPERSGISDYSVELLEELSKWYQIDVIVVQESVDNAWVNATMPVRNVAWFLDNAYAFDRVLYHFGNSEFHRHMFELLPIIPGVVVLHDFYLSGIISYMSGTGYAPLFWKQSLYHSHGYKAVYTAENETYPHEALWTYPANLKVIQDALGMIVHSENSKKLAEQWYNANTADWYLIPHLRTLPAVNDKLKAREALKIDEKAFVICSFGIIGKTKRSLALVEAFINSDLAKNPNCYLYLVGQNDAGEYGQEIITTIKQAKLQQRICITGWTDTQEFRQYLQAGDVGVQLRTLSRGETSGTVLDCFNYGLATIVNANGSMAYLEPNSVSMIPDEFSQAELIKALETVYQDTSLRQKLSNNALETIRTKHDPQQCAMQYYQSIEQIYQKNQNQLYGLLNNHVANQRIMLDTDEKINALAHNFPATPRLKQIFVDVTLLAQVDAKSGIQRVVRSILASLLRNPPQGYRVEPVYADSQYAKYWYARKFTAKFLDIEDSWAVDSLVEFNQNDIFLVMDLHQPTVIKQQAYYSLLRNCGVKVAFIAYDLLPILQPQNFSENVPKLHEDWLSVITQYEQVICISQSVADEVTSWLDAYVVERELPLAIDYFHLGADLDNSLPSTGLPNDATKVLKRLSVVPSLLMVGTLEPRKGHAQVLKAFEQLWQQDQDINLVIVGKTGWEVEELAQNIRQHKQIDKRLFWLEAISDEYLEKVYNSTSALIAASYGEGFGLPLIEAAQHNLPIIARDIPVFREVAGDYAVYFEDTKDPSEIATTVETWLKLAQTNKVPEVSSMPWLTWEQSTEQLLDALLERKPSYKKWTPKAGYTFWGNDKRFHSQVGVRTGKQISTDNQAGFLVFGPHLPLKSGNYELKIMGEFKKITSQDYLDLVHNSGEDVLLLIEIDKIQHNKTTLKTIVTVEKDIASFELRVWVDVDSDLRIDTITLTPMTDKDNILSVKPVATIETKANSQQTVITSTQNSSAADKPSFMERLLPNTKKASSEAKTTTPINKNRKKKTKR